MVPEMKIGLLQAEAQHKIQALSVGPSTHPSLLTMKSAVIVILT